MTPKDLAQVCTDITIKLIKGGVPQELAVAGVTIALEESMDTHKEMEEEARCDAAANYLKTEFAYCLQD